MSIENSNANPPARRAPGPRTSLQQVILLICMIASGGMFTVAMFTLLGEGEFLGYLKVAFCVLGAMAVSYGVNKCALDRGAPLAVIGYRLAGVISILSILFVGGGLFGATYAGLVIRDVSQLRLEAHGSALTEYVNTRSGDAAPGAAMGSILSGIADDLEKKAICERSSSCVSNRPAGGRGPVTRTLETMAERAKGISAQFGSGVASGTAKHAEVGALLGRYATTAAGSEGLADKRVRLQGIDAQIRQALSARKDAAPLALALAYANELQGAGIIPGQPEASRALSAILQAHGQSLRSAVPLTATAAMAAPEFPKAAGVADTFAYLGHFAPIAAITAVVELVFPIVLWSYVALTLAWDIERVHPRPRRPAHADDEATLHILSRRPGPDSRKDADPDSYFRDPRKGWTNGEDRPGSH